MTRLLNTFVGDVRLQFRQGFYYAAAFALLVVLALVRYVPAEDLRWGLPLVIFGNVQMNAFYFLAGLVLLEKTEGTLEAQVVTPLRPWEYLAAKVVTLALLGLVENVVLVLAALGAAFDAAMLVAGVFATSVIYSLAGFLVVARYQSINEFLMPSFVFILASILPLLPYFGVGSDLAWAWHPLQPGLALLRAAAQETGAGPWLWATPATLFWILVGGWLCRRTFRRFVVAVAGGPR